MQLFLFGFVVTSLSWLTYWQFKPRHKTMEQRVVEINANFGTEFACGSFLGRNGDGFLFDDKNGKICHFMGEEGELLDFDYFKSWAIAPTPDHAFIFLTTDRNRPVIKINVNSLAEMAIWRKRLADSLPPVVPQTLAA